MKIDQQKLAELATCIINEVNGHVTDNAVTIGEFSDRYGQPCRLKLLVEPAQRAAPLVRPEFNCILTEH